MSKRKSSLLVCASLSFLIAAGCKSPVFNEAAWQKKVESTHHSQLYEPHEKEGLYFTPWIDMDVGTPFRFFRWKFSSALSYTQKEENFLPVVRSDAESRIGKNGERDFLLWIGHGSYLIKTGKQLWLLDPIFSRRALLPARKTAPALTAEAVNRLFPKVNVVISHGHYDHLDENSVKQLAKEHTFYVPLGVGQYILRWKPGAKVVEMDWWQRHKIASGFELHSLPAQHWSMRALEGPNRSLWASYMIVTPKSTIYFGGDSGYFVGYREFGNKYPKIDYALLPTTAYHPRWFMHKAHMNAEEAIQAFQDLKARYFVPTQWGTFRLGDNPPGLPMLELRRLIRSRQLDSSRYLELEIGELLNL